VIANLEWWCADFCFCAETEAEAKNAVGFLKNLAEEITK
jgi:hypothetical protein